MRGYPILSKFKCKMSTLIKNICGISITFVLLNSTTYEEPYIIFKSNHTHAEDY